VAVTGRLLAYHLTGRKGEALVKRHTYLCHSIYSSKIDALSGLRKGVKTMSTDYCLEKKIPAADVLDGRLMAFGVREQMSENTTEASKCLTDGRNYIWFYIDDDGAVSCLSRYGGNVPSKILQAIATIFDTDIFSEYEPQFWGFDSQEEWDAAMEQMGMGQA
jgi:hypothetical protein